MSVAVSIIVPIYNVEKYLERCIESLIHQTFTDIEILLIDDGSQDKSGEICQEYAKQDNRVKYFWQENAGQSMARNNGVTLMTGKYVVFVDSDDYLPLDAVAVLYHKIEQENAGMVIGNFERFYDGTKQNLLQRHYRFQRNYMEEDETVTFFEKPSMLVDLYPAPWGKIFRKDIIVAAEMKFPLNIWYEDFYFFSVYLPAMGKIAYVNHTVYKYAVREGSVMTSKGERLFELLTIFDWILEFYEAQGLAEKYRNELEFLLIQHVLIGMFYRILRAKKMPKLKNFKRVVKYARRVLPNYNKTTYLKNEPLWIKCFVQLTKILF